MRVNIYAEEMPETPRLEIIEKKIEGSKFTALRIYLELPVSTYKYAGGVRVEKEVSKQTHKDEVVQVQGPFIHHPGDDDSAAITFWGKKDLRITLREALKLLDKHYASRGEFIDRES